MSIPSDPHAAALLAHIVSQIRQNVDFLVSENYMSSADASAVVSRLPSHSASAVSQTPSPRQLVSTVTSIPAPRAIPPPPPAHRAAQARAIWAYNQNGEEPDDLSFSAGDIIEIISETNADWWTGRVNGKEGLFPSNHVEKLANEPIGRMVPPMPSAGVANGASQVSQKPVYRPFMAAHHGSDAPPTSGVNSVGLQQDSGQEQKTSKYGKYGNTMAHSAAAGVGFGAGSAIGGGLVRAIF